jgi:hypothetical protein
VDDLPQLIELWTSAKLPAAELDKQFTDFQVAEDDQGKVVGAIGLQIDTHHGRVHSEAFTDFGLTDTLRPALWQRLQTVAQNHGLFRLWTVETAPWWKKDAGFAAPAAEVLEKLPTPFGERHPGWLTLRLKDETADPELLDKELAAFKEVERLKREKLLFKGRVIRVVGTVISAGLLIFGLIVLFWVLRHRR